MIRSSVGRSHVGTAPRRTQPMCVVGSRLQQQRPPPTPTTTIHTQTHTHTHHICAHVHSASAHTRHAPASHTTHLPHTTHAHTLARMHCHARTLGRSLCDYQPLMDMRSTFQVDTKALSVIRSSRS